MPARSTSALRLGAHDQRQLHADLGWHLDPKIGGTTAGSQFDQVNVSGTATYGGALTAQLTNGFGPAFPEAFTVLTAQGGSTGSFATTNMPSIDGMTALSVQSIQGPPADLNLVAAIQSPDLAVQAGSITVNNLNPASATGTTGQRITVGYTVQDLSPNAATGTWTDSVYLSASGTLDVNALLLGRTSHTGGLAGLASYNGTLTVSLPGVVNGNYYLIVVTDSQQLVLDINRANNIAVSTTPLRVSTQLLSLGTPVTATISNGQDVYYMLDLTSGPDVQIAGTYQVAGEASLFVRYAAIPDSSDFDEAASNPSTASPTINLAQPQGGNYYILIQGQPGAGSSQSFTLSAIVSPFAIDSIGPEQGSNAGQATLTVTGSEYTSQTVVQLNGPGGTVVASAVQFKNDTTLYATFNLTGLTLGSYEVQAIDHGNQVVTAPGAFQVVSGNPGRIQTNIATYGYIRPYQTGTTVTVYYANIGDTDIPAPLLTVQATNAVLGYADQPGFVGSSIPVLGIDQDGGPAGILPPGYHGSITLNYQPTTQTAHTTINFTLLLPAAASTPIDWSNFEAAANPSFIPSAAWNAIWSNFAAAAGSTVGQYQAYVDGLANYFSQIGDTTSDVDALYDYAIYLADASLPVTTAIGSVDASVPTPGLALTFERVYQPTILGRYQLGPLGYSWTDNWQITVTTDSQGNVTIDSNGVFNYFVRQSNGNYLAPAGDYDVLTLVSGAYQLRQTNGRLFAFNPNGSFDYIQDSNGNRITAGYTTGEMTSLTDSSGAFLTLAYNTQGLISTITDSNGQVTNYTYDTANELLLNVSSPEETQQYTYVTGSNPAQKNGLATITKTDGTNVYLTYDAEGRLINQQGCLCPHNPIEHLIYTYGTGGTVTTTDNTGASTAEMVNSFGEPTVTQDALGQITRDYYDDNGNLIRQVLPNGTSYAYKYDARGNLLGETDPLGNTTNFTYDTDNNLTSYTDANGNTTDYAYNSSNDLLSTTYANGADESTPTIPWVRPRGFSTPTATPLAIPTMVMANLRRKASLTALPIPTHTTGTATSPAHRCPRQCHHLCLRQRERRRPDQSGPALRSD